MNGYGLPPGSPPAVTVRLNGNLTAQVLSDGAGRTLVVYGIRSARTLRHLSHAVGSWHAFGRYDRVLLDLSAFSDGAPDLHAVLADDVRQAAAAGRCLGFVPQALWTVVRDDGAGQSR
jgi:hypothetical protein